MKYLKLVGLSLVLSALLIGPSRTKSGELADVPDFRHMRVENPASLTNAEAEDIYREISASLAAAFESSGLPDISSYQSWRRYNTAPYLSSTHGNRYINNFANAASIGYDALQKGTVMPEGSVVVKDSFEVTENGEVLPGRLFVMEKRAAGSLINTADWRYIMIGADGSVIADTIADTAAKAEFCHVCHKVRSSRDFLFYVPPDFRN